MLGILLVFGLLLARIEKEKHDPRWDQHAYAACLANLRALRGAITAYERDQGHLPKTLADLFPTYIDHPLQCPLTAQGRGKPYHYTPEAKKPTDPLVTCMNHGQGPLILQRDGQLKAPK